MDKYELGNEFKENIERLPSLSLKQKIELLENNFMHFTITVVMD